MLTITKTTYKELEKFAQENGYAIAYYQQDNNGVYHLVNPMIDFSDTIEPDTILISESDEGYLNLKQTFTEDKKKAFILQNNWNLKPTMKKCPFNTLRLE